MAFLCSKRQIMKWDTSQDKTASFHIFYNHHSRIFQLFHTIKTSKQNVIQSPTTVHYCKLTSRCKYCLSSGCQTAWIGNQLQTFRDNLSVPYSQYLEDGTDRMHRKSCNYQSTLITYIGKIQSNTNCLMFFTNKMFLHCFLQRHVSALALSHFLLARQAIKLTMLYYCYKN